jgi:hypothetical protein
MKFEIRDVFATSPEVLWAHLCDPAHEAKLAELAGAERQVLSDATEGDVTRRSVRMTTQNPQMAALAKLLGSTAVAFDQHFVFQHAERSASWRYATPAGDRIRIGGTWRVSPHAEGAERVVEGEVVVNVPLMGGTLEGKIVQAIKDTFAKGSAWRKRQLAGG